jgi:SAM-dependent methyltransferase
LWFGYPDSAFVYQCRECDHVFVAGELSPEQLTDMYTNYYPRSNFNVDEYQPYKEKSGFLYWLDGEEGHAYRHVPKNVRVLDIGCGYCETLGYHKTRGCEVYGVEADENARQIAERYGFNIEIGLFDPKKYEPNFFDYVTMDKVLEHIVDPLKTLQEIHSVLKPGGRFIATVPNPKAFGRYFFGKYWLKWHLPFHRHCYSHRSMEILAENAGYKVVSMRSATESVYLLYNWGHMFAHGKQGKKGPQHGQTVVSGHFDSESKKRLDIQCFTLLKKIRFLSLPMRLADMFGIGDGNLIVLQKK